MKLFWSDERNVPPDNTESNYHMAMQSGLSSLPLSPKHIFRMKAENDLNKHAADYETLIKSETFEQTFDLITLGMGDDGHTASLFPHTAALKIRDRWVAANWVPQKNSWRMTFTYPLLERTRHLCLYVLGEGKAAEVAKVFSPPNQPEELPSQAVGTKDCKALWILDKEASSQI